jgi:M6 family metalloprotease-like protein
VIGKAADGQLVYLSCGPDGQLHPQNGAPEIDQKTGQPAKGPLGINIMSTDYLNPPVITGKPTAILSEFSTDLTPCKIADAGTFGDIANNPQRHFSTGFPLYPERAKLDEKTVVQFIPVDFADLKGKRSPSADWAEAAKFLAKFWEAQGSKELKLDIRFPSEYTHMPKSVLDYDLAADFVKTGKPAQGTFAFARLAVSAIDAKVDFSDVDVIAIVPPAETTKEHLTSFTAQAAEPTQGFKSNEKEIMNLLVSPGKPKSPYEFLTWAHEFGHMLGLSDLRNVPKASAQDSSPLGVFDIMNSFSALEILAWQRFLLGTIYDNQVNCVSKPGTFNSWMTPLEAKDKGVKLTVVPTGKYTAIAIESRRSYGFDLNLGSANNGLIVYKIDTTIPYYVSAIKIVPSPSATDAEWRRDAALKKGETVTVDGVTITNVESGAFGDVAKIEKK